MTAPILSINGLSKTFAGQRALADLSLDVQAGEILSIVGQNGCGKSTLVKILAGFHTPDPGAEITAWGEPLSATTPGASHHGLHFIHQDLALVAGLSTTENLALGQHESLSQSLAPTRPRAEASRARKLIAGFGGRFDVNAPISALTPTEQTIVAIARAFDGWESPDNLLVLDEPTAALHPQEVEPLFNAIRELAQRGAGVMFISHRLNEVLDLSDRVAVLRDGRNVRDVRRGEYVEQDLVKAMTGGELDRLTIDQESVASRVMLEVSQLAGEALDGVDFAVHAGEVVGATGLVGSGCDSLAGTIFGSLPQLSGTVRVDGKTLNGSDPRAAISAGVGFVPADRRGQGALMTLNVRENLTLPLLKPLRRAGGRLSGRAERKEAQRWITRMDVRPPEPERPIALLSGGNQQKVVIAKWLRMDPKLLLLDEPTQGVDVGAKLEIHRYVRAAAEAGAGVLVCSGDMKELIDVCDRVLVFRDGHIVANIPSGEISESRLTMETLGVAA
jgi:ABC-type sugar transport system ATPase subunit